MLSPWKMNPGPRTIFIILFVYLLFIYLFIWMLLFLKMLETHVHPVDFQTHDVPSLIHL